MHFYITPYASVFFSLSVLHKLTYTALSSLIECRGQTLRRHSSSLKASSVRRFINECNRGHMAASESLSHMSGKNITDSSFHTALPAQFSWIHFIPVFFAHHSVPDVYMNSDTWTLIFNEDRYTKNTYIQNRTQEVSFK